jgi:hypothetical protein
MIDSDKLVDLAESLIPKVTTYGRSVGMNVTDEFTTIPTDNEVLQISDSTNGIFRKKYPDYEVKCWNRSFWDNLKRRYYKCVWLTVRKMETINDEV